VTTVAGVSLVFAPAAGVLSLTVGLGIVLMIQGGIEFGVAIDFRSESSFPWILTESLVHHGVSNVQELANA
jgi:uncharacterized membrane protein HdeD (DUF308 family)